MKKSLLVLLALIHFGASQLAFAEKKVTATPKPSSTATAIDMYAPPFWVSIYEEYSELHEKQKSYYLKNLLPVLHKVPALKKMTDVQLLDASMTAESWNKMRVKVYEFCQRKSNKKTCEELADVRIKMLEILSQRP